MKHMRCEVHWRCIMLIEIGNAWNSSDGCAVFVSIFHQFKSSFIGLLMPSQRKSNIVTEWMLKYKYFSFRLFAIKINWSSFRFCIALTHHKEWPAELRPCCRTPRTLVLHWESGSKIIPDVIVTSSDITQYTTLAIEIQQNNTVYPCSM